MFCENNIAVEGALCQKGRSWFESYKIISLNPLASYTLEKQEINFSNVLDYPGNRERIEEGLLFYPVLDKILEDIDKEILSIHEIPSLKPAQSSFFSLKILFDLFFTKVQLIQTIIKEEKADRITLIVDSGREYYPSPNILSVNESVNSCILRCEGWGVPVDIVPVYVSNSSRSRKNRKRGLNRSLPALGQRLFGNHLRNCDYLFNMSLIGKRFGLKESLKSFIQSLNFQEGGPVLIHGYGYNWEDCLPELYRTGLTPVFRTLASLGDKNEEERAELFNRVFCLCQTTPSLTTRTRYRGVDLSSIIIRRTAEIITDSVMDSVEGYHAVRKIIKEKKIKCLLVSTQASPRDQGVIHAAHDEGIPVVSWQHGGAGYCFHPMMPYAEFINSDIHFVFGEGIKTSYLETACRMALPSIPHIECVGSRYLLIGR